MHEKISSGRSMIQEGWKLSSSSRPRKPQVTPTVISPAQSEQTAGSSGYVCNLNTKKFHYPYCGSVAKMKETNKKYTDESREELISQGFDPCKNCNP